jgi:hypothetical protein
MPVSLKRAEQAAATRPEEGAQRSAAGGRGGGHRGRHGGRDVARSVCASQAAPTESAQYQPELWLCCHAPQGVP